MSSLVRSSSFWREWPFMAWSCDSKIFSVLQFKIAIGRMVLMAVVMSVTFVVMVMVVIVFSWFALYVISHITQRILFIILIFFKILIFNMVNRLHRYSFKVMFNQMIKLFLNNLLHILNLLILAHHPCLSFFKIRLMPFLYFLVSEPSISPTFEKGIGDVYSDGALDYYVEIVGLGIVFEDSLATFHVD